MRAMGLVGEELYVHSFLITEGRR